MNLKSVFTFTLKILIAAGLILFLVKSGHLDFKVVWDLVTPLNVAIAVVLMGINTLLATWRWVLLLKSRGLKIPIGYGFSLFLIGSFFSYALPGAVSGDLIRGYYLVQDHPTRRLDCVLSILIDRILGLYSFFIISLVAIGWDYDFVIAHEKIRLISYFCLLTFLGMTTFFCLCFSPRLAQKTGLQFLLSYVPPLKKLMEGFQRFGQNLPMLGFSVLSSLFAQFFSLLFFYLIGVALHEPAITWTSVLFAVPLGFVVTALPIAPAGVGVGQVAFLYLFQTFTATATQYGAVGITAFQITNALWALVGVFFYLRRRKPHEFEHMKERMEAQPT